MIDIYGLIDGDNHGLTKKIPLVTDQVMATVFYVATGNGIPPHIHAKYDEVHYVVEGSGKISIEGIVRPVKKGNLILVPRGKKHRVTAVEDGLRLLVFNPLSD